MRTKAELEQRVRELEAAEKERQVAYVQALEARIADLENQIVRWRDEAHRLSEMGLLALQKAEAAVRAYETSNATVIPNARDDPDAD